LQFEALVTLHDLGTQVARPKRLYIVGDITEAEYDRKKRSLDKLIEDQQKKIAPPSYNVDELIEKVNQAGQTIAGTTNPALFKQAVGMLFERLETVRPDEGKWKLSKVIPRKELRDFL
jgi:hypothetical protein